MILRVAALLAALAGPAAATTEGWPALFDVAGVAADDVLNIRTAPGTGAEVIGTLAPDATDIEVIRPNDDLTWGLVNTAETTGWVSLGFLARQPGQWSGQAPAAARCFGTEPFWSLDLATGSGRFETPDSLPLEFAETADLRSNNRVDRHTRVYENDLGGLVVTLRRGICSDGMSDRAYGWDTDLMLVVAGNGNAQMFSGCCTIAP